MPLPIPDVAREHTHTRRVRYEGYVISAAATRGHQASMLAARY
jgi:hypothetical protein